MAEVSFPKYEYNFEIIEVLFERAQIGVIYKPVDERLTNITYYLPMVADFDINNLKAYVDKFAPYDKWFAQDMILQHESKLLGAKS